MIYNYLYINNYLKPALVLVATVDEPPFWKFGSFINVFNDKTNLCFLTWNDIHVPDTSNDNIREEFN